VPFTNPIVAGNTLVRTAIQSPNFVAGSAGWSINRDGSAEFNNVTVRGSFEAGGGNVTVNSGGVEVIGPLQKMNVDDNIGFIVQETTGPAFTNMAIVDVNTQPSNFGGYVALGPPVSTQYPTVQMKEGQIAASRSMSGNVATPRIQIQSPAITLPTPRALATIQLSGERDTGGGVTDITLSSTQANISGGLTCASDVQVNGVLRAASRVHAQVTITPVAGVPTSLVLVYGVTLTGTTFYGQATASTSVVGTVVQGVAITNITATQCTVWVTRTNTTNTVVFVTIESE